MSIKSVRSPFERMREYYIFCLCIKYITFQVVVFHKLLLILCDAKSDKNCIASVCYCGDKHQRKVGSIIYNLVF